jgi:Flp pilus assembly protein CpaB
MKQKNVILMVVAVGCGLVAAFLTTQINAKPKSEQVEVLVAAKDLAVGTLMSKAEMPKLVTRKKVAKESLPPKFVVDESELLDKRLSTAVQADQTFNPEGLSTRGVIILPEGKDMISLPVSAGAAAAGFIGPGSKVDVLATLQVGKLIRAFPLLVDMHVLAVDTHTEYDKKGVFPTINNVSLAVSQEQALLLALAKQRGCRLELLLRHPNKPVDPNYNISKVKLLLSEESRGGVTPTAGENQGETPTPEDRPPTTTVPPVDSKPNVEVVKVLKAAAPIPANTEITKDLLAQSFVEKEVPKEHAEALQACTDLTPFFGQVFKTDVPKDSLVIKGMFGPQSSKASPREEFIPDKKGPTEEASPAPKPEPTPSRPTRDTYSHSASGTLVYRYEEVAPNDWRLKAVLTPEQARNPKAAPAAGSEGNPQEKSPEAEKSADMSKKKID